VALVPGQNSAAPEGKLTQLKTKKEKKKKKRGDRKNDSREGENFKSDDKN